MKIGRRKKRRRTRTSLAPMAQRVGAAPGRPPSPGTPTAGRCRLEVLQHALECAAEDAPPQVAPLAVLPAADHRRAVGGRQALLLAALEIRRPGRVVVGGVLGEGELGVGEGGAHDLDFLGEVLRLRHGVGQRGNGHSPGAESPPRRPGAHVRWRRDVRLEQESGLLFAERTAAEAVGRHLVSEEAFCHGDDGAGHGAQER